MNVSTWKKFNITKEKFKDIVKEINSVLPNLKVVLQEFADGRGGHSSYTVDTPVVYNTALDKISRDDEIKLILVADNPGRREQMAENKRYLVGPSGKIAAKFFRDNPCLGIDFTKNVIILNKTPIHTPRTSELRDIVRLEKQTGKQAIAEALEKSQIQMAALLLEFQKSFNAPVWITGYSEMKKGGLFETYTNEIKRLYFKEALLYKQVFFYRHFSMNQFTIDLKKQRLDGENVDIALKRIGTGYRERILGNG